MKVVAFNHWCAAHQVTAQCMLAGAEYVVRLSDFHTGCVQATGRGFALEQAVVEAQRHLEARFAGARLN